MPSPAALMLLYNNVAAIRQYCGFNRLHSSHNYGLSEKVCPPPRKCLKR